MENNNENNDIPKKTSFFGKMGNMFNKGMTNFKSSMKEINLDAKTLSEQTKVAAVAFKEFGKDVSKDFKVNFEKIK